ncbi:hypothetical protein CHU98_g1271 [Xylaria longipes]|nr:hypothetical protein CHU98_g1271 [Xylaria longipes]
MSTQGLAFTGKFHVQNKIWTAVDAYTQEHVHPPTASNYQVLLDALRNSRDKGLPDIATAPTVAKMYALQCKARGVKHALEFGTLGGYTSIWLATINPGLQVTSLEINEHHKAVAQENLESAGAERNASNAVRIEDFCRYKYIVHTEGVTYSGRFQFHNLCASVVLTPPVAWVQHVTHLLRPVFSYALDPDAPDSLSPPPPPSSSSSSSSSSRLSIRSLSSFFAAAAGSQSHPHKKDEPKNPSGGLPRHPISLGDSENPPPLAPYPAPWVRSAWPTSYSAASEANIVFVAPDWSDLEATVAWLDAHPGIASGIARRQRVLFEGGGYLSPAAETCYWRGLIRGWSEVVRVDEGAFEDLEEVTWEEFSLKEIHK